MIELKLICKNGSYYTFDVQGVRHKFFYSGSGNNEDLFIEPSNKFHDVKYFLSQQGMPEKNYEWEIQLWRTDMKLVLKMLYVEKVN